MRAGREFIAVLVAKTGDAERLRIGLWSHSELHEKAGFEIHTFKQMRTKLVT